jgi:hypothetical protein
VTGGGILGRQPLVPGRVRVQDGGAGSGCAVIERMRKVATENEDIDEIKKIEKDRRGKERWKARERKRELGDDMRV